jgi:zinc-binding alcohol dehydrogenase/oxidoreductase
MGSTMGNDAEYDAIVAEFAAGRLMPPVDSITPLAEGRKAFERLQEGGQFGKLVLKIS